MSLTGFNLTPLPLVGAMRVSLPSFSDNRGSFCVLSKQEVFDAVGMDTGYVQQNLSVSRDIGTVRGLHYQSPPFAQAKFVSVLGGRIADLLVDARPASPTYGQYCRVELSTDAAEAVFVPRGFLHGFMTLEPETSVLYSVDNPYAPEHEVSVAWDDPELDIEWPQVAREITLSAKDARGTPWREVGDAFATEAVIDPSERS